MGSRAAEIRAVPPAVGAGPNWRLPVGNAMLVPVKILAGEQAKTRRLSGLRSVEVSAIGQSASQKRTPEFGWH